MADNTTLPGTGDVYASDDRGGVKFQKVLTEALNGPSLDAFGRMRVSEPTTIFDSKLIGIDDAPLFWEEAQISGSSTAPTTPTAAKPYIDLASINTTAGVFVRQTYRRFNYQPGKSQLILMTGVLELASGTKTGCQRRIGYFDDNNGLFFESNAGTIGVTVRTNDSGTPADTTVVQTSWNLDTMDGGNDSDNPSGLTADWTNGQIFVIDFQWLSFGRVRFGLEIKGMIVYVHEILQANTANIPYMSTPNLPLRFELISTTSSGICSMRAVCASVVSEGGADFNGVVFRTSTAGAGVTTDNQDELFAVVGIRLKTTHVGTDVRPLKAEIQVHTASEYLEWVLLFNPTVAGTFAYANITNSSCQRALGAGATNTVTGGTQIAGGYVETGNPSQGGESDKGALATALKLGVDIAGTTADEIVLCVRPIGGVSAATVEGALTWRESL